MAVKSKKSHRRIWSVSEKLEVVQARQRGLTWEEVKSLYGAGHRTVYVWVEGREEGNFIVMMVEDAGPGIAPENVNHLFQAYFSTKGSEGTGVGLFLAQEVIKAHGGTIEVRSEVGKGTAFIVRLPKYREAAA